MKTAVLLSGCGVYDGSEIHEAVFALSSLSHNNIDYFCVAPDINQHHLINHFNGEEIVQDRNVLHESARITRGEIYSLSEIEYNKISSLVIPGGFGVAKNLSDWAFNGVDGSVLALVKELILHCINNKKPIVALCISPVIIAKSLEGSKYLPELSLGTTTQESDYNIREIHDLICTLGAKANEKSVKEICVDEKLKIISAPCYMMKSSVYEVHNNIKMAIDKLNELLTN